jgi:serine/threonine protein phosphatase PrpC
MINSVDWASISVQDPHKKKNGDFCTVSVFEEEKILLAVVADGVSTCPCDWKASQMCCEEIIAAFSKTNGSPDQRLLTAVERANRQLLLEPGSCEGLKSTLSVVVWSAASSDLYFVSIGDSRVYAMTKDGFQQLSIDETATVIRKKMDGKPIFVAGSAVVAEGVTNLMGTKELTFEVRTFPLKDIEGLLLASDGFYRDSDAFRQEINWALNNFDLEAGLDQLREQYLPEQRDDMTAVIIRPKKEELPTQQILVAILKGDVTDSWSKWGITHSVLIGLKQGIESHQVADVRKLLDYCSSAQLSFGREQWGNLISLMVSANFQDSTIYQELRRQMGKSYG